MGAREGAKQGSQLEFGFNLIPGEALECERKHRVPVGLPFVFLSSHSQTVSRREGAGSGCWAKDNAPEEEQL